MDVKTAGIVHFCSHVAHLADALLKFGQLIVGELGRHQLYLVGTAVLREIAAAALSLSPDTGVAHQLPGLALIVLNGPGIIPAAHVNGTSAEGSGQSFGGLLPGNSSHLDFYTEALVFQSDHADASSCVRR